MSKTHDYGEPWIETPLVHDIFNTPLGDTGDNEGHSVIRTDNGGVWYADCTDPSDDVLAGHARLIQCAQACAGVPDPAAALTEFRSSMTDLLAIARIKWGNLDHDANKVMENAQKALKLLTPSKP